MDLFGWFIAYPMGTSFSFWWLESCPALPWLLASILFHLSSCRRSSSPVSRYAGALNTAFFVMVHQGLLHAVSRLGLSERDTEELIVLEGACVTVRIHYLIYIYTHTHSPTFSLSLYAQATCEIQLYTAGVGWCVFRLYAIGSLRDFTAASLVGAWKNVSCSDGPLPTYGSSSK